MTIENRFHTYYDRCGCEHFFRAANAEELEEPLLKSDWKIKGDLHFCPTCKVLFPEKPVIVEPKKQVDEQKEVKQKDHAELDKEYLNEKEVSKIIGISLSLLRKHRYLMKGIPYIKFGRSIRYKYSDLIQYLDDHRIEARY